MRSYPATPLDDVLCAFAMAKAAPDVQTLEEYTRRYPAHADLLTEFAVSLLIDDALADDVPGENTLDDEAVSPAVSRAISFFQNALYEAEGGTAERRSPLAAPNIFGELDRTQFRAVAQSLHANNAFVIKLRDRSIKPETVIRRRGFCRAVAEATGHSIDAVIAHFQGAQQFAAAQHFKADLKPEHRRREEFEDAVRNSGLSPDQQSFLLGL